VSNPGDLSDLYLNQPFWPSIFEGRHVGLNVKALYEVKGVTMFNPLRVELKKSGYWWGLVFGSHAVAGVCVVTLSSSQFVTAVLLLSLLLSLLSFRLFPINAGVSAILWNEDANRFCTLDRNGLQVEHPYPRQLIRLPFLICIKLDARAPVPNQWLILLPDMMSRPEWRRLHVLARWSELEV